MKTPFIFLCLIVASGLANATVQNKTNPDKPPIVYVNQYSDNYVQSDGGVSWGASKNYSASYGNSGSFSFVGKGAYFYHFDFDGDGWWDVNYDWSSDNPAGSYVSTGDDASGPGSADGSGTGSGNFPNADPYDVPSTSLVDNYIWGNSKLSHFYANINYYWGSSQNNYTRTSKTFLQLKTGGKTGVSRQNLFSINASATEYGKTPNPVSWYDAPDYWQYTPKTTIDPTRIRVLGQNVGNDGNLFTVLPDNATLDLVASAPGKHYSLNVTATKHKLYVQSNNSILQPDYVVPTGTFSVGQKLVFSYFFYPAVDGIASTNNQWLIGGAVVNGWNSLGNGYNDYFFDTDLLKAPQATLWHYGDSVGKKATINLNLQFSNGQRVKVAKTGLYTIVKPEVTHLGSSASHYGSLLVLNFSLLWTPVNIPTLWLSMGSSTNEANDGNMEFTGDVKSKFPGAIGWTQFVNCTNESSFPLLAVATGGNWNLDGSLIYDKSQKDLIYYHSAHTNFYAEASGFTDCPGIPVGNNYTTINTSFMTFLRFKPSSPDSIWVTLARADWAWHAEVNGDPAIVVNDVTGPTFTMSNQFPPMWYGIKNGASMVKDAAWYILFGL